MGSNAYVRTGEIVKAYPVSRYVDPANPKVMHERHVVYRVERNNLWRMVPPDNRYDATLLGPVAGVRSPSVQPSPIPAELSRELQKQKQLTRVMEAQTSALSRVAQENSAQSQAALAQVEAKTRNQAQLEEDLESTKSKLTELESKLETLQKEQPPLSPEPDSPATLPEPEATATPNTNSSDSPSGAGPVDSQGQPNVE